MICCNEIDDSNYVEYLISGGTSSCSSADRIETKWIPCMICEDCVETFIKNSMPIYLDNLLKADCRASQLRVLAMGPPIYVKVCVLSCK